MFRGFDLKQGPIAQQLESLTAQMSPDMQKCFLPVDRLVEAAMAGYDAHFLQMQSARKQTKGFLVFN